MSEWEKRELCPDGGCVGVLGPDGTCKTCGKRGRPADAAALTTAADSDGAMRGEETEFDEDEDYYYDDDDEDGDEDDEDEDDDDGDPDAEDDGVARVSAGGGEWSQRQLCPDGGCVGVLGDDGRCKVCGKTGA